MVRLASLVSPAQAPLRVEPTAFDVELEDLDEHQEDEPSSKMN